MKAHEPIDGMHGLGPDLPPEHLPVLRGRRTRRVFLAGSALGLAAAAAGRRLPATEPDRELAADDSKALVAITLDLEMSRHFPEWDDMHWDYEKGNVDAETKAYTVEACRRVKAWGGVIHTFAVGRVLEQEKVDWLRGIARRGHPVGNHTYDHVNVKATRADRIQFRFRRAPWLIEGMEPRDVIRRNIAMTGRALKLRAGIEARGFRTPGGFHDGLVDRGDVQKMLLDLGFRWVSSQYPQHANTKAGVEPGPEVLADIVRAQEQAQPFVYPSGLIEVPMSPPSDVVAMRTGRWKLESFLSAVRKAVEAVIEKRLVFDFLAHPSCLYVVDPEFRTMEMICDLVRSSGGRAALADLDTVAERARLRKERSSK